MRTSVLDFAETFSCRIVFLQLDYSEQSRVLSVAISFMVETYVQKHYL